MRKLYIITFICGLLLLMADVSVADFSDDFEDGTINTSLWVTGGYKRGWRTDIPPGVGNWDHRPEEIVDATDGYLSMHVWGPTSGNTYGAEAWVRTKHDFNDGKSYLINFTWEPEFIDWHFNFYHLQITDGYIPVYGNVHWAHQYDYPGTVNLLRQLETGGSLSRGWHYQNSPPVGKLNYSITIEQAGIVKLYDAPNAGGTLLREEPLDPGSPWYIRFMTIDATSSGFPSGECRLNLYDFSAEVTTPGPQPEPWRFVQISDTHIGRIYAYRNLDATIMEINDLLQLSPAPDFVLVTGDIAKYGCRNERFSLQCPDHYSEFKTLMDEKLKIPYYVVPGNHDWRRGSLEPPFSVAVCTRGLRCYHDHFADHLSFQPPNRDFLFIGLDTGAGEDLGGGGSGELSEEMTNYYKWKGTDYPTLPKIVFMHHPGVGQDSIRNPDEFLNWCDANNVKLVLAGHTHEGHVLDRDGNEDPADSVWPKYVQTPSCGVRNFFDDPKGYRIFDVIGDEVSVGVVEGIQDTLAEMTKFQGNSPINLHMYDSAGGHVGIGAGGEVEYGIPNSFYHRHYTVEIEDGTDVFPETIYIFSPTANYLYEVVGTEGGTYGLDITSTSGGEETTFEAADIPTFPGARHIYAVDWGTLSAGGEGVILNIDKNGDGFFEQMAIADNELSYDEFALQTETVVDFDPDTLNLNSQGKFATVYIELPEDFDVSEIDLFTLALNELVHPLPKPIEIGDYDSDGTNDLMVKFDIQELIAVLEPGEQIIDLTGRLLDGRPIAGFDIIRMIH